MIRVVRIGRHAKKQLAKAPQQVVRALLDWQNAVERRGLQEVRKVPGYHDEPLKGKLAGTRSIRLSQGWRAFYELVDDERVVIALVVDVTHHVYRGR